MLEDIRPAATKRLRVYQRALTIAPQWRPAREAAGELKAAIAGQEL